MFFWCPMVPQISPTISQVERRLQVSQAGIWNVIWIVKLPTFDNQIDITWELPPTKDASHQDYYIFRIGNPDLNLHLHWHPGCWVDPRYQYAFATGALGSWLEVHDEHGGGVEVSWTFPKCCNLFIIVHLRVPKKLFWHTLGRCCLEHDMVFQSKPPTLHF